MSADGIMIGAGAIAFAGNWKEQGDFPSNGVTIIGATLVLTLLFSTAKGTAFEGPTKALAGLSLLAAVYRYVPAFTSKKGKKNG